MRVRRYYRAECVLHLLRECELARARARESATGRAPEALSVAGRHLKPVEAGNAVTIALELDRADGPFANRALVADHAVVP